MRRESLFALIFVLSGCGAVQIKDDPWCADAGKHGAWCFNAISNREFYLNKYEWDKRRLGQICSATERPGEGYINVKTPLEKLCADTNRCTPEQKKMLESLSKKADKAMGSGKGSSPF